jgi:non-homologous end joining protein Ku
MVQILNQFSFLLAAGLGLAVLAYALLRDGVKGSDLIALASLALGFTAAFALLRPRASTVGEAEAALRQIGQGTPVLLEFQSPY